MKITNNSVVNAEYELYVDGENGGLELMERATPEHPLNFIFGVGMMLPKFEQNLKGLEEGDSFDFTIANEDAYGEYDDEAIVELDRAIFEIDGKLDEEMVYEGNIVPLMDSEGNRLQAQVVSVTDTNVTVDLNHPLAGENLHFKGKILEVHEASEEELNALLGNGCGCGDDCNCGEGNNACGCGCGN
jgi:FKBP-type peptidyl-prolyl cis-trans isomerase SlyD